MEQNTFFESVVEPSTERLGLYGIAHDVNFDGRHFIVSHKVSKVQVNTLNLITLISPLMEQVSVVLLP